MTNEALSLSDIALQLNSISDIETLFGYSVNAASVVSECDFAAILMPDYDHQTLSLASYYSLTTHPIIDFFSEPSPNKGSHAGHVLRAGEAITLSPNYPKEYQYFQHHQVESVVFLPLTSRLHTIGVLVLVNWSNDRPLSPTNPVFTQLAALIGLAIENTNLYLQSQRRSLELALIIDATEAVSSTLSLAEVLSLISKNLFKAVSINWCEIYIIDERNIKTLLQSTSATWKQPPQNSFSWDDIPHLAPTLKKGKKPYVYFYDDGVNYTQVERSLCSGLGGTVFVPLRGGLLQLGWLETDWDHLESILSHLASMGEEIALKIRESIRALYLAHQLLRHTQTHSCRLWFQEGDTFHLVLDETDFVWRNQPFAPTQSLDQFTIPQRILGDGEILTYTRQSTHLIPEIQSYMDERGLERILMIPFMIQSKKKGLIILGSTDDKAGFQPHEISLAQGLVLQAANAIRNAQLYEELQQSIAELRLAQARLVQTARLSAVGELAAAVVHQINNPLATILGDAQILLSDIPQNSSQEASVQAILRAGQHAKEVVRRLLSVARQKSPSDHADLMDINLSIQNTISLVTATLKQSRILLRVDLDPGLPYAYGLTGQLEDVWLNLILNARDAVRGIQKPTIGIQSLYDVNEKAVKVIIWDNGYGFQDAEIDRLFEAFYTTKPQGEGTGLGLYICASVIEKCHGNIKVGLSPVGGAMFTVSLPTQPWQEKGERIDI